MFRNIVEINNPGPSNHFDQLVHKCVHLLHTIEAQLVLECERLGISVVKALKNLKSPRRAAR